MAKDKVLVMCSNCLYSVITPKIETDPKHAKFALLDSCPKCNIDSLDEIRYFDAMMTPVFSKPDPYGCPHCNEPHCPQDEYEVDEIKYPIYKNEIKGGTMDGNTHDWDEIHNCLKCNTIYEFRNGAY